MRWVHLGTVSVSLAVLASACSGGDTRTASSTVATPSSTAASQATSEAPAASADDGIVPAGPHQCGLATQDEIDDFFGTSVPEGVFQAPFVSVVVCTWETEGRSLVLEIFPTPAAGPASAIEGAQPMRAAGMFGSVDGTTAAVALERGDVTQTLTLDDPAGLDTAALDALAELATTMVDRLS